MTGPATDIPSLSLIVPLYNEEARVGETFDDLVKFARGGESTIELIFVDDGSTDRTRGTVRSLLTSTDGVDMRLLCLPHQGKGAAVRAGIAAAHSEYAGFCDVDLSTPLDDFRHIFERASKNGGTLAIGSREAPGANLLQRSRTRQLLGRLYNRLLRNTVIRDISDTQCGAKIASVTVWQSVLPYCREVGFAWDAEAIAIAQNLGIKVEEVPIVWRHDARSKVQPIRDGIRMVLAIRRIEKSVEAATRDAATKDPTQPPSWDDA